MAAVLFRQRRFPMKTITFIGSGNVATHLAQAFRMAGHNILQIFSREFDHAERLAERVFAEPVDKMELLYPTADVYVLAVSDNSLYDLALDLRFRDALVLHTSGATSLDILKPISRRCGVLWSPQSFVRDEKMDYSELPFCIEGSTSGVADTIVELAASVSSHIYRLNGTQRQYLHLAAVLTNNFGNALNALAQDVLKSQGIPFKVLLPIIAATAQKAMEIAGCPQNRLWSQQTGPAIRRDDKTILLHRKLLQDDPELMKLYEQMTSVIQDKTARRH